MSLQSLKKSIREVTERKVASILEEARAEAEKIIEEASRKAEEIKRDRGAARSAELEVQGRSELAMEELKGRRRLLEEKAAILDKAFKIAEEKLSGVVETPRYHEFLRKASVEAVYHTPGEEVVLRVNERDKHILKRLIKEVEKEVGKVERGKVKVTISQEPLEAVGGILSHTPNQKKYYNNTLEARVLRSRTWLKGRIYKILFGGEGS